MGYIIFATGRRVTIATAITGNAGTSTYSFRIRSGPNGITVPASGLAGFFGTSQAGTSNGPVVNASGQLRIYVSGTNRYGSTSALITSGVQFDYTLTHTSAGAWDIFNNLTGSPTGESGTFTTSTSWVNGTSALNQMGRSSNSNAVYLVGDMEIIAVTGLTNAQEYDAALSGGTGLTLPTTSGSNQGTLDGFGATDADNWGGFSTTYTLTAQGGTFSYSGASADLTYTTAGATYTLTAQGGSFSYSGATAGLLFDRKMTAQGASYAYSGGQAALLRGFVMQSTGGVYSYSGGSADLTYVAGPAVYRLTALGATYAYLGGSASLTATGVVPAANPSALVIQALVGGTQSIQCRIGGTITNNARIGGRLTINAMVAV